MRPLFVLAAVFGLAPHADAVTETVQLAYSGGLRPTTGELVVSDTVTLPALPWASTRHFDLQAGLTISEAEPAAQRVDTPTDSSAGHTRYAVQLPPGPQRVTLRYRGKINLPPEQIHRGFGRDQQASCANIGSAGVYLDGSSAWYPVFADGLLRFSLDVDMPAGWCALSQGTRGRH